VCNHLAISLLLDDIGVALGFILAVGLGLDEELLMVGFNFFLAPLFIFLTN
jgi:hypothetical protein